MCNTFIPKIIHQIHIGDSPLSDQQLIWRNTWIEYNPDWTYMLWNDEKISYLKLFNQDQYVKCSNWSEKSDILRFEILYQYGGLYIDTDFECLRNINSLIEHRSIVICRQSSQKLCGAFLAAAQNHPKIKKLIDNIQQREQTHGNTISDCKYGPEYITDILGYETGLEDGWQSLKKIVYPYMWWETNRKQENFKITHPEAYAVHHWLGSWCKHD